MRRMTIAAPMLGIVAALGGIATGVHHLYAQPISLPAIPISLPAIPLPDASIPIYSGQDSWVLSGSSSGHGQGWVLLSPPGGSSPHHNAMFHQVVDRYYDAVGNEVDVTSSTHVVGYDCHSGMHRRDDLVAQDDGGGGRPQFVALLMGSEPTTGQPPLTPEGRVKVVLAMSHHDDAHDRPVGDATVELAQAVH